ncbi:TetR/AcrR family transcriptional regulator [Propionicicella superfundia]|uniref:TetR/AcrR family transcriptional regulator n=1 Tax=Propionicicella superfundia TaxID=348582 RepID=UPI0004900EED|nr:TetR/AcrR family transcriptional regulator [Propionicicella superfundia]
MNPADETAPRMRSDARRNMELIRDAALQVFGEGGLTSPLDEVARVAGVSKGTIYNRYGGREGLIDAVVEDLVAERIAGLMAAAAALDDPVERFESYLRRLWLLQYDEPAANDVLLRTAPGSRRLSGLCEKTSTLAAELLAGAQAAGGVRSDLTIEDIASLIWERGIIARACVERPREAYERSLTFILDGLRARAA